jgi:Fic family protein
MEPERFRAPAFGEAVRELGADYWSFRPKPLARALPLDAETVLALSAADTALGRLAGAGRQLHDPGLFVRPYMTREALASSRIEGTQASLSDVFEAEAGLARAAPDDVREVQNYVRAMEAGLARLRDIPISGRLIREIHAVLMTGVRGRERRPGEFRDGPVWIGSPTDDPHTAIYVPPSSTIAIEAMRDWELFANDPPRMPRLIQCALLHYQFETIHPFFDGNGRLGRLLIAFFLVHGGPLPAPLLYVSAYLEQHRREYYERLQAVREKGEIQEWLQFFLTAVAAQSEDAIAVAERLHDLRETYRSQLAGSRSRASEVVDELFVNPVVSIRRISNALGMTHQGATNLIRQLEDRGWLEPLGRFGRGATRYWMAVDVLMILNPPPGQGGDPSESSAESSQSEP